MKINQNTKIIGKNVILVPYRSIHVPKYHEWMASEELQKLTASERLTLEEEYEMQQSWAVDEDKCTFIILDRATHLKTGDETGSMIGDVNLFLTDPEDRTVAELELMIADPAFRRLGLGKEAALLMLKYGTMELGIARFEAKIGMENLGSLKLFKEVLGFQEIGRSTVFEEVTLSAQAKSGIWMDDSIIQYNLSSC